MVGFPSELETVYNDLEITNVSVRRGGRHDNSLAFCDVTFNESLKINNIEVFKSKSGAKDIIMPYRRDSMKPKFRLDYAHPVDKNLYNILKSVLVFCEEEFARTGKKHFGYSW